MGRDHWTWSRGSDLAGDTTGVKSGFISVPAESHYFPDFSVVFCSCTRLQNLLLMWLAFIAIVFGVLCEFYLLLLFILTWLAALRSFAGSLGVKIL